MKTSVQVYPQGTRPRIGMHILPMRHLNVNIITIVRDRGLRLSLEQISSSAIAHWVCGKGIVTYLGGPIHLKRISGVYG